VRRAFEGAYGAFCVTFFWDHLSVEREQAEAAAMARAAKAAGVQHVIWSTLDDTRKFIPLDDPRMPTLHGKYKVPHFDGKGEADQYFRDAGVPTTFLLTVFYWDNFIYFGAGPKAGPDGTLALTMPMGDKKRSSACRVLLLAVHTRAVSARVRSPSLRLRVAARRSMRLSRERRRGC
jgi:uncharacterized protein YbjT (DUF2867 family)